MITLLDHTNISLSGQCKLDVFISEEDGQLVAKTIKVSPLSEDIPYSYKIGNDFLYPLKYNIKKLHDDIQDAFYGKFNKYASDYFITDDKTSGFDDTTKKGPKNCSIKKYGEQLSYLLPLWVGGEFDLDQYKLVFKTKNTGSKTYAFPKNLIEYLSEYYNEYKELTNSLDNIAHYDLSDWTAWISGLDVSDGTFKKVDCSYVIENLKSRERTLLEQNYMIAEPFAANTMIVPNLLNINLIFNPSLIDNKILETSIHEYDKVSFEIKLSRDEVEQKDMDFYWNHHDILDDNGNSIFNETLENRAKDLIYINKQNPFICHWSLNQFAPDMFNLYSAFSSGNGSIPFKSDFTGDSGADDKKWLFAYNNVFLDDKGKNIITQVYEQQIDSLSNNSTCIVDDNHNTIFDVNSKDIRWVNLNTDQYVYANKLTNADNDTNTEIAIVLWTGTSIKITKLTKPGDKQTDRYIIWANVEKAYDRWAKDLTPEKLPDGYKELTAKILYAVGANKVEKKYKYTFSKGFKVKQENNKLESYYYIYKNNNIQKDVIRESGNIYPLLIEKDGWYSDSYFNVEWKKKSISNEKEIKEVSNKFKAKIYPYLYFGMDDPKNYISIEPYKYRDESIVIMLGVLSLDLTEVDELTEEELSKHEDELFSIYKIDHFNWEEYYDRKIDFDIVFKYNKIKYNYKIKYTLK